MSGRSKGGTAQVKEKMRSARADLQFPVNGLCTLSVASWQLGGAYGCWCTRRLGFSALLSTWLPMCLKSASNSTRNKKMTRELNKLQGGVTIEQGDTLPNARLVQLTGKAK
ncbi:Histone H2A type 1-A [Taenia solium]|eukprot:TsM_000162700 transcript=TsM_000162700 gene=TsM_000162700